MNIPYIGIIGQNMPLRDVGKPQAAILFKHWCLSVLGHAIVSKGRTQAADTLHWGRLSEQSVRPAPQKTRSRGCPRAPKQFLPFAQLPSWQLAAAQKKQKQCMLKKLFRKSRSTPVNTSNIWGRAGGAFGAMPALFLFRAALAPVQPMQIGGAA